VGYKQIRFVEMFVVIFTPEKKATGRETEAWF
jgi:hypothetical protein